MLTFTVSKALVTHQHTTVYLFEVFLFQCNWHVPCDSPLHHCIRWLRIGWFHHSNVFLELNWLLNSLIKSVSAGQKHVTPLLLHLVDQSCCNNKSL